GVDLLDPAGPRLPAPVAPDHAAGLFGDLAGTGVVPPHDRQAVVGQAAHRRPEAALHVLEVLVDVGVVELDRGEDAGAWTIVQELRPLVEEGRVVLVALDDEVGAGPAARGPVEVLRDAADEEARPEPAMIEQPR